MSPDTCPGCRRALWPSADGPWCPRCEAPQEPDPGPAIDVKPPAGDWSKQRPRLPLGCPFHGADADGQKHCTCTVVHVAEATA